MSEFFAMGGYAAYVWPCYGASALVLGLLIYFSVAAHRSSKEEIRNLEEQMGKHRP